MRISAMIKIILICIFISNCKATSTMQLSEKSSTAAASVNNTLPWVCAKNDFVCQRTPWGRTNERLRDYISQELDTKDFEFFFSQYSRPNDDTRGAANPVAAAAIMRGVSEGELLQTILRQNEDLSYKDRPACMSAAVELMETDSAAYEVVAVTFAIAATQTSATSYRVAFTNALESTTQELVSAASTGPFTLVGMVSGKRFGGKRYQGDLTSNQVNSINHSTISLDLASGAHQGQVWIDGGRRWIVCKVAFELPLNQSTSIICERFKFPLLYHIRSNTTLKIDEYEGRFVRWLKPDLTEPHNCKGLETHADTDELSPDSKLAFLLRSLKIGGDSACLSCHTMNKVSSYPGLFCPSKNPSEPFDPYGRPKEVVEVGQSIAHYFQMPSANHVPKWDQKDIWSGEIEVMHDHFAALVNAYCDEKPVEVPTRNARNPVQQTTAKEILDAFLQPIGGLDWQVSPNLCKPK